MDKYEFNLKVEQLNKLVKLGDYKTAMRITDTIDWRRVHSAGLLTTVSEVYEKNNEYKEAREILLLAHDRAPVGKRVLYKLAMLSIKDGDIVEAEDYYKQYIEISPQDSRKYIMEYLIAKSKNERIDKKIRILEKYNDIEVDEQWKYELAALYASSGRISDAVRVCDEIMLLFGVGENVEKAAALKESLGYELSPKQQERVENKEFFEDRLKSLAARYESGEKANFPSLDNIDEYKPKEDIKTTIDLGAETDEEVINNAIDMELFPRAGGIQEARISETTFKGESVNPEFEVELKKAIAITRAHIDEMKEENPQSSMEEIDEEVRAHMEKIERIKHGRFGDNQVENTNKTNRINNYFDSRGLPRTYGSRSEYEDMEVNQNTWISEDSGDDSAASQDILPSEDSGDKTSVSKGNLINEDSGNEAPVQNDLTGVNTDTSVYQDTSSEEYSFDMSNLIRLDSIAVYPDTVSEKDDFVEVTSPVADQNNFEDESANTVIEHAHPASNNANIEPFSIDNNDNSVEEAGIAAAGKSATNVTITETASTKVMENYVPEKATPIFDADDLINSYYDEEAQTVVPTVSEVLAQRKEERNISKSTVKSEAKMEVVGDEEVYYTKEEKTFITKVKRDETDLKEDNSISKLSNTAKKEPETLAVNPEKSELKTDIEEDKRNVFEAADEEDDNTDTITIEESIPEETGMETELSVHGKIMKAKAPKSEEPREYLMRRPGSIIVEGVSASKALENAIEVLKEVNELTKIKHAVLKIRANSLNARGVMNSIDKIKGKDLIIEEAGELNDRTIAELIEFVIDGKQTVVFSDTISGVAKLIEANDLLHSMSIVMREEEEEQPVRRKNFVANIVLKEKKEEEEVSEGKEEKITIPTNITDIDVNEGKKEENITKIAKNKGKIADITDIIGKEDIKDFNVESNMEVRLEKSPIISISKAVNSEDEDLDEILDTEEFINYALDYADKIDCFIPDKTKSAIEERVDYMKEDEMPLSKKNAISLIEAAADLAENPSIAKRIFGFMSPRYDREDRLILREEHFKI